MKPRPFVPSPSAQRRNAGRRLGSNSTPPREAKVPIRRNTDRLRVRVPGACVPSIGPSRPLGSRHLATETGLARTNERLGPVPQTQLCQQPRDVVADRLLAEAEVAGDATVVQPLGDQLEDSALAFRRVGQGGQGNCPDRGPGPISSLTATLAAARALRRRSGVAVACAKCVV